MSRKRLFTLLWVTAGIILGSVLGWLVLRSVNWSDMVSAFGRVSWDTLVPAVSAVIASLFMQAVRLKLMLPKERVSTTRLFFVRNAGLSLNNLSFAQGGGVLGDASELAMLTRSDKIDGSKVVASLLMSRVLDFVITSIFVLAGFFIIPQLSVFKPVIIPMLIVVALLILFVLFARKVGKLPLLNRIKVIQSSLRAVTFLRDRKLIFWLTIFVTVIAWMLLGTAAWLVAEAIGIQLPFWTISILLVGMTLFAGAIPAAPSALGTYEFVTVYILGLFSVNRSDALCFALVVHALVMLPPNLMGIPTISREWKTFRQLIGQAGVLFRRRFFRRRAVMTQPADDIRV
jgi:uncharacterized membrane protein YbhN (UPF0104 family)